MAREEDLLVEHVDDETVVYDERTTQAHCLTPLAAVVFANCDGETTIEQLTVIATERLGEPVDEPQVIEALMQLLERDLLSVPPRDALSRRQMVQKSAAAGGALVGASLITTIVAPTAYAAASQFCTQQTLCQCCACGCVNTVKGASVTCDNGGNNCCEGQACSCTQADSTLGEVGKHCKPGKTGAVNCQGFNCTCGTPGVGGCNANP